MPELPDLEVVKENLSPRAVGKTVRGARVFFPAFLKTWDPPLDSLVGLQVQGVGRRGKYL
ncbi:MAG TPA: Fpg/Nei family DNA glycosylase, partial [Candidatus Acetothermia bacterium]|nr:Fpg/Nei family DNA glycosylase [Candidatus Acetothermia bacterium]